MTDNILMIEPQRGLGFLKLESSINYILTELKSRGDKLEHADIVLGEAISDPIHVILLREGIKLRFEATTQRLELIEIDVKAINRYYSVVYKGNILLRGYIPSSQGNPNSNQHSRSSSVSTINISHITYNYINSIFGPSDIPRLIDSNKYLLLRYDGISFLFDNLGIENEESIVVGTDAALNKIIIFKEKTLCESISNTNNMNYISSKENTSGTAFRIKNTGLYPNIKIDVEKGLFTLSSSGINTNNINQNIPNNLIKTNWDDKSGDDEFNSDGYFEKTIALGENVETVLYKLSNPNYIYYKPSETEYDYLDYEFEGNSKETQNVHWISDNKFEDNDYFLNYYSLGIDVLIDGVTNKTKKLIFHTNSPFDARFGIYNRCNFSIEINKNFFQKINDGPIGTNSSTNVDSNNQHLINHSPRSRKISEDSSKLIIISEEKDENVNHYLRDPKPFLNNSGYIQNSNTQGTHNLKIENTEDFSIVIPISNGTSGNNNTVVTRNYDKEKEDCSHLSYKDSYTANLIENVKEEKEIAASSTTLNKNNLNNVNYANPQSNQISQNQNISTRKRTKTSFDIAEKSFSSINESNTSISLNNSDILNSYFIYPFTNFYEILNRVPQNSYFVYHKHEGKLNSLIKYYVFDGFIFEVLENYSIASVTLFKSCR